MNCVDSVQFAISINGSLTTTFAPQKGIRQGDPLLPYLFILVAKYLSRLIVNEQKLGHLHGIKITRHCSPITHSQFAHDLNQSNLSWSSNFPYLV